MYGKKNRFLQVIFSFFFFIFLTGFHEFLFLFEYGGFLFILFYPSLRGSGLLKWNQSANCKSYIFFFYRLFFFSIESERPGRIHYLGEVFSPQTPLREGSDRAGGGTANMGEGIPGIYGCSSRMFQSGFAPPPIAFLDAASFIDYHSLACDDVRHVGLVRHWLPRLCREVRGGGFEGLSPCCSSGILTFLEVICTRGGG